MKRTLWPILLAALAAAPSLRAQDAPVCTDRPTKANAPCVVPQGRWQLEADVGSVTRDVRGGLSTQTVYPLNPTLKYGLGGASDIEVSWAPRVRVTTRGDGARTQRTGHGDLLLRVKTRLHVGDAVSVAVIPFVKAPTATTGFGNDRWEGGVALPVSVNLPRGFALTFGPQLDVLADADGRGHHAALSNLVNLSHPLGERLTLAVEYWRQDNADPQGTVRQASADVALIVAATHNLQLDVGANLGLNDRTPDRQFYAGIAYRW
ncbi:transporter [Luteibacter sp. PPL552]